MSTAIDPAVFAPGCAPVPAGVFIAHLLRTGFSTDAYRDHHPDLKALNWIPTHILAHFFMYGLNERREVPMTLDPGALVDLAALPLGNTGFKSALLSALGLHLFDEPGGAAMQRQWPIVRALATHGARPYVIAGDEAAAPYFISGGRAAEWLLPIPLPCTGVAALDLPDSAGDTLRDAISQLETLPGGDEIPLLLNFGFTDLDVVYHDRRRRDGKLDPDLSDYRAFCDATIERYMRFALTRLDKPRRLPVYFVAVAPPTVPDGIGQERHPGSQRAALADRVEIHAGFNARLRDEAKRYGFGFIGGARPFLGGDGLVEPRFLTADGTLNPAATAEIVHDLLWACLDTAGRPFRLKA